MTRPPTATSAAVQACRSSGNAEGAEVPGPLPAVQAGAGQLVQGLEVYVMDEQGHHKQQLQEQHTRLQQQLQVQQAQHQQHQQQLQAQQVQILELQQQLLAATSQQQRSGHVTWVCLLQTTAALDHQWPPAMPQVSAASGAAPLAASHTTRACQA